MIRYNDQCDPTYMRARKEFRETGCALMPPEYYGCPAKAHLWRQGVRDEQQAQARGQAVRA